MLSFVDTEIAVGVRSAGNANVGGGLLPDEQPAARTPLQAVLESLRKERDRLAEARLAAELACVQRVHQLEQEWVRERDEKYHRLAQVALTQAREKVESEYVAKTRAVKLAQADVERERNVLEAKRRKLELDRQAFQPAEAALREDRDKFDRDRLAWQEYRLRELQQSEQERNALVHQLKLQRETMTREPDEHQKGTQMASGAYENWYSDKLAGIRHLPSSGRSARLADVSGI
jgi:hypothetical protein